MTIAAYDDLTDKLYDNLSILSNHCDSFKKKFKLCKEGESSNHKSQSSEIKPKESVTKMATRRSSMKANDTNGIAVSNTSEGIVITIDKNKLNL